MSGKKILFCLVFVVQVVILWSKEGTGLYNFQYYGTKDGLPQVDVMSVFQDEQGYIWAGTQSGAVRYNGRTTRLYATDNGMAHNTILDIQQDREGVIYFATHGGISLLKNDTIHTIFPDTVFHSIFVDRADNKWFYGETGFGLLTAEGRCVDAGSLLSPSFQRVYSVTQHPDSSSVYLATERGLYYMKENYECMEIIAFPGIYYVYADKDHFFWIAAGNDLYRIAADQLVPGVKLDKEKRYPYLNHRIKKITQAADASIWGITSGFAFQINSFKDVPDLYNRENGLAGYTLYSLFCDYENNTWIGMVGGLQKLGNKSIRKIDPSEYTGYISNVFEDKKGRIWFASESNVCYIDQGKVVRISDRLFPFHFDYQSIAVQELSNGNILIVHPLYLKIIDAHTLSTVYTRTFNEPIGYVECVYISSKGEIFVSDSYNGILYYLKDYQAPKVKYDAEISSGVFIFTEYKEQVIAANHAGICVFNGESFEQKLLLDHSAWGLYVSGDDLWVGTENGLGVYRNDSLHFLVQGTVNSICRGMDDDHLWIGKNDGAKYICLATGQPEIEITEKDGLSHNEVSIGSLLLDRDNLLWIGTYQGLSVFDYHNMPHYSIPPRNDLIINVNNVPVSWIDSKDLPAFDHSIHFEMTALSFTYESDNLYEYFLKGPTKDSIPMVGKEYTAQYNNLPPGNYVFMFRTKGKNDLWSEYTSVHFSVPKPFWVTWWFYLICLLAFGILLYLAIHAYTKILRQRNQLLENLVTERTALIQKKNDEIGVQNQELKETREEIEAQNEELSAQNQELYETFSALRQVNDELESYKKNLEAMVEEKTSELVKARDKAEESDKLKSAFLANMSHEIRTPMNGIIGLLNIITDKDLPLDRQKEYIGIINSNSQRLLKLINDILDISKLEVGQLQIVRSECRVNELMQELRVFYDAVLQDSRKRLVLIFDDSDAILDFTAYLDPFRLKQILSNLIDNAIKFTEFGYIKYGYRWKEDKILFYVEDTGVGMNEDQLKVIFDRFRQANDDISAKYGGTGLGLAISKNLVNLMGGEIWVASEAGMGTTFYFSVSYVKTKN
ncbi:MAG: hypothetical protein LBQ60_15340 [Bacteroidales bacterium]|jgi:signal transduction histidine kinase/ligand-binding sensor domain-containing protein|nr:hypothetical protein [Bacteroidales bacterium]